jgi:hypothetical protein
MHLKTSSISGDIATPGTVQPANAYDMCGGAERPQLLCCVYSRHSSTTPCFRILLPRIGPTCLFHVDSLTLSFVTDTLADAGKMQQKKNEQGSEEEHPSLLLSPMLFNRSPTVPHFLSHQPRGSIWNRLLVTMFPQAYPTPKNSVKGVEHLLVSPPSNGPESSAALIAKLKGQTMHVPDMLSCFPTCWPSGGRNKYYKRLKARFDEIIEA